MIEVCLYFCVLAVVIGSGCAKLKGGRSSLLVTAIYGVIGINI